MPDSVAGLETPALLNAAKPVSGKARAKKKSSSGLPDLPENARKADLPLTLQPQLATLVDEPPSDPAEWTYEIKFDGYRILTRIDGERVQLFTRNGNDWSHKVAHIVKAIGALGLQSGWLDGEVIVPDERGIPDFQELQNAFDTSRTKSIIYYVFDVPFYAGFDLKDFTSCRTQGIAQKTIRDKSLGNGTLQRHL